ncbi:MAG: FHA domain-containing protein [Ardenticatenaceae bacterium]
MLDLCPNCTAPLRSGARFCRRCGHSVQGEGDEPRLVIEEPGKSRRTVALVKWPVMIGRKSPDGIEIPSRIVSQEHARLELRGGEFWITDLDSTNGTLLNGHRIKSEKLHDGDIIRIGDPRGNSVGITFHSSRPSEVVGAVRTETINLGKLKIEETPIMLLGREPACHIRLDHPSVSRRHAQLEKTAQGHQIRDLNSRHGTFVNGQPIRGVQVLENGDVLHIGPFKLVYDHELLSQFSIVGHYRLDAHHLRREVSVVNPLSFKRLWFWLTDQSTQKVILSDITLSIHPKEFVALVGGSGAGKSTLLKALSGFVPAEGQMFVNREDLYENFAAYRSILGYVPQDDIIHRQLKARSALTYAAQLRLPDMSSQEIEKRVSEVLEQVEMTEHADKVVNRLSGGQRKRVSIAVELLAEPGLFFLDEPTSGLDPGLEKKMMYTLRQQADAGRTIVLVTHATANIDQCTQVAFLADGCLMYFGPPQDALTFFEVTDFADIYTRLSQDIAEINDPEQALPHPLGPYYQQALANGETPRASELWAAYFKASPAYQEHVESRLENVQSGTHASNASSKPSRPRVSLFQQFWVLTRRYFHLIRRDSISLLILLLVMPLIGFLLLPITDNYDLVGEQTPAIQQEIQGKIDQEQANDDSEALEISDDTVQASYLVVGSTQRLLFMLALAVTLLGLFAASNEIIKEAPIYNRERMVNLEILPYLLSKITVLGSFALLQCLMLLLVLGLDLRYPSEGILGIPGVVELYITLFLASLASITLGLWISSIVRSSSSVIYLVLLALFLQILFAGAIFELPNSVQAISYLTPTRWTLEALGSTVDMHTLRKKGAICVEFEQAQVRRLISKTSPPCENGQLKMLPEYEFSVNYNHTPSHLLTRWGVLALFAVAFSAFTFIIQERKDII